MSDERRPGIGDNAPPEPTPLERAAELVPACDDWTSKGLLSNEDDARLLSEFLVQIRKARAAAVEARDAERKPHEDALALIDGRYKVPLAKLDIAIERIAGSKKVVGLLADWMARERNRIAEEAARKKREAEEAERAAQTMADRAATAGTIDAEVEARQAIETAEELRQEAERRPGRVRVKGDLAPKAVGLRDYWSAKIIDWTKARRYYRQDARVVKAYDEAVQVCANDDARRLKDKAKAPDGIEFQVREQAQ
jgi:hypothetical protein